MRSAFRIIAYVICALIAVQAAAIAWMDSGLFIWVSEGGVLDKSVLESEAAPPFAEVTGMMIHGMNGMMVIPVLALVLLVVGLLTRTRRGIVLGATVLGLTVLQVALGMFGHGLSLAAMLHGLNALLLFAAALVAARSRLEAPVERTPEARVGARV
ncbi:hypothetical protein [Ornithinimicrobium avium]|uniref:Cytochrome oxidase assembly protein n=1 Tax=Ornithinimicrobium avium TaxID=2283195 RepID=A0A345NLF8_9MICO|nr:hypothetical protein [Ornithinimicrobium avium]AXH95866.1 hypothetical protein DV701_06750 [Ornithinimicrobium avium]